MLYYTHDKNGGVVIMSIVYNENLKQFQMDTVHSSYIMGVVDKEGFLGHAYYGRKVKAMSHN